MNRYEGCILQKVRVHTHTYIPPLIIALGRLTWLTPSPHSPRIKSFLFFRFRSFFFKKSLFFFLQLIITSSSSSSPSSFFHHRHRHRHPHLTLITLFHHSHSLLTSSLPSSFHLQQQQQLTSTPGMYSPHSSFPLLLLFTFTFAVRCHYLSLCATSCIGFHKHREHHRHHPCPLYNNPPPLHIASFFNHPHSLPLFTYIATQGRFSSSLPTLSSYLSSLFSALLKKELDLRT